MSALITVAMLAILFFIFCLVSVGRARVAYGIKAPAVTGNERFERYYRVQQNTLEQLVIFLPVLFAFGWAASRAGWPGYTLGSILGLLWIAARILYFRSYVRDPEKRGPGFVLTFLPSALMLVGTLAAVAKVSL